MFSDDEIRGNAFIYFLFQICNIALSVLGFLTLCIAIYLIIVTKNFNPFNIFFLCFGISLMILSYFGCKLKYSPLGNLMYILVLSGIFLMDFIVTIASFFNREKIIEWVMLNYNQDDASIKQAQKIVDKNISTVNDFLLMILFLFVKNLKLTQFSF